MDELVQEKEELAAKIEKLGAFLDSDRTINVLETELHRMRFQFKIMKLYLDILEERIENL